MPPRSSKSQSVPQSWYLWSGCATESKETHMDTLDSPVSCWYLYQLWFSVRSRLLIWIRRFRKKKNSCQKSFLICILSLFRWKWCALPQQSRKSSLNRSMGDEIYLGVRSNPVDGNLFKPITCYIFLYIARFCHGSSVSPEILKKKIILIGNMFCCFMPLVFFIATITHDSTLVIY